MKLNDTNFVFKECLSELEKCYREVLELRFIRQMSNEKIARRLNLPVATIESRLWSARNRLCERLESRL